jgi:predicted metal-dependent hydrolase
VKYFLRISPRAQYLRVEVPFGGPPLVVVPRGTPQRVVDAFLAEKRDWIDRQLARYQPRLDLPRVRERDAREIAREDVTAVAEYEAPLLGVEYRRIRIAGQKTVWGSCSSRGTLSFNWRLALVPPEALDYVVVHELCHLRVPNHSQRFWRLLESVRPDWRDWRDWLLEFGPEILAYRPL